MSWCALRLESRTADSAVFIRVTSTGRHQLPERPLALLCCWKPLPASSSYCVSQNDSMKKQTREKRAFGRVDELDEVSVRLIKKFAKVIDGVDLAAARIGDVLTLTHRDAALLLAEGWAVPAIAQLPRAEAADPSGSNVQQGRRTGVRASCLLEPAGWEFVKGTSLNTLVIGTPTVTRRLLHGLRSYLRTPVADCHCSTGVRFHSMPDGGTIILRDIHRLLLADQHRLSDWLECSTSRSRVISTSPTSLMPLLMTEVFVAALYYRLNTLYIATGTLPPSRRKRCM